jgi:hypothetical protein
VLVLAHLSFSGGRRHVDMAGHGAGGGGTGASTGEGLGHLRRHTGPSARPVFFRVLILCRWPWELPCINVGEGEEGQLSYGAKDIKQAICGTVGTCHKLHPSVVVGEWK